MSAARTPSKAAAAHVVPHLRLNRYIIHKPTPLQAAFLLLSAIEAFFGGAAGPGKSEALLMAALQYVDEPGYAALIVRETFVQLSQPGGLMFRANEWLAGTDAVWNAAQHTWRFPSGATLTFGSLADSGAQRDFQGAEYQFVGFDEVTEIAEGQYQFLFSRLRRRTGIDVPLRMRSASNPVGPGRDWCYRRFILGKNPDRVFIPARLEDNPHLDPSYEDSLEHLPEIQYQQLRNGDWTIRPEGGLFRSEWFTEHALDRRELPDHLNLCRYWDLASTEARGGNDPDFTVGVLLGKDRDGVYYICDVVRLRASPLKVQQKVRSVAERDKAWANERGCSPPSVRIEEEPGSAGAALISHYRRDVLDGYAFKGVRSTGSKETRAEPVAARAEAGDIGMCHGSWNDAFLDEIVTFPLGAHDDQVDALAGAYEALRTRQSYSLPGLSINQELTRPSPWKI